MIKLTKFRPAQRADYFWAGGRWRISL